MTPLQDLTEVTPKDIQSLIDNNVEESIHLEFKAAPALENTEHNKKEIAKDVSSFANSDGGIIVYGISEKKNHADSISFVDGNAISKEWLEQVINSNINRRIVGIQIFPVRFDDDISKTVYVVKIPRSDNAPHMSCDYHYYRRYNFAVKKMEEYEVRDAMLRQRRTILKIENFNISNKKYHDKEIISFVVGIKNVGNQVETIYKVNMFFLVNGGSFSFININWNRDTDKNNYYSDEGNLVVSGVGLSPIFPGEEIDMCRFKLEIQPENFAKFKEETTLKIVLFFSGGKEEIQVLVKDHLEERRQ